MEGRLLLFSHQNDSFSFPESQDNFLHTCYSVYRIYEIQYQNTRKMRKKYKRLLGKLLNKHPHISKIAVFVFYMYKWFASKVWFPSCLFAPCTFYSESTHLLQALLHCYFNITFLCWPGPGTIMITSIWAARSMLIYSHLISIFHIFLLDITFNKDNCS